MSSFGLGVHGCDGVTLSGFGLSTMGLALSAVIDPLSEPGREILASRHALGPNAAILALSVSMRVSISNASPAYTLFESSLRNSNRQLFAASNIFRRNRARAMPSSNEGS